MVLASIAIIVFILDRAAALDGVTYPLRRILSPVQTLSSGVYDLILSPVRMVSFMRSGEQRIKFLEQRNLELLTQVSEDASLRAENADLRKQLGADVSKAHLLEPAKVLGVERYLEFQINDAGKTKVGQTVVYLDNYVGKIIKTGQGIGYVQLVTDPDSKIPVKTDNASGIALEQFYSDVLFDKVSKSDTLNVDDNVVTSGTGGITEPGLSVGKVAKIVPSSDDLFQKAQLLLNFKSGDLKEVYIIID